MEAVATLNVRRFARNMTDDRGAGYIAAFIVLLPTLLLAGVGLLVDSARYYTAYRQADAIALEAARAAANALDANALGSGGVVIDAGSGQAAASAAAGAYVTSTGHQLTSVVVEGDLVTVTVSGQMNPWFPLLGSRTVTGRASAHAQPSRSGP